MSESLPRRARPTPRLKRALGLMQAVLYGLGVTIGAGIYVLIGAMAREAGLLTPIAFLLAAALISLTAASFAEMGSRVPVSASEAAYVEAAFKSRYLSLLAGILVVAAAVVSAAAIAAGSVGYIQVFVDLSPPVILTGVLLVMGAIAAWGIVESVTLAGLMTMIEVGGLLLIIGAGLWSSPDVTGKLPEVALALQRPDSWVGISGAALLAVFAFIGFEGLANINEELVEPARTLPLAILLTLAVTAVIYVLVAVVALAAIGPEALASTGAPLALVFQRLTRLPPLVMSGIAVIAVLNGIIVQIIVASRVLYGLSSRGLLPSVIGRVHARTQTPLAATALTVAVSLLLALTLPLEPLADATSRVVLVLFALVNLSLIRIKRREALPPRGIFLCWRWVPYAGLASCLLLLGLDAARSLLA